MRRTAVILGALLGLLAGIGAAAGPLPKPFVVAHRGAGVLAPENTLAAIRKGIELGVSFVEVDVRTTADGELVLMHDSSVSRTTDGTGEVRMQTAAQIAALDAGSKFGPQYAGEPVPTFAQTLDLCRGKVGIYIDPKDVRLSRVVAMLRERDMVAGAVVYCDVLQAMEVKRLEPKLAIMPGPEQWLLVHGVAEDVARSLKAEYIDSHVIAWTKDAVEGAHRGGAKVCVDIMGPTDNSEGWQRAIDLGVDGMQTDRPDELLRFLGRAK
jgi:glycerophosphoryl diester phosphodiesterase